MALLIDTASAARRLSPDAFARWAATRTVFVSSEMRELGDVRAVVATALRGAGFSVVMFEELGGPRRGRGTRISRRCRSL